jgi:hypothetical protein
MTEPIISRAMIVDKAREAFARGTGRDDHGFNWHSVDAIATWQDAWDACAAAAGQLVEVSPP